MKASKLHNGQVVDLFGTLVCLRAIVEQENGVRRLTGQVVRGGGREVTHPVHPDSDIPLCNWDGVRTEGKTKAEVKAESVVASLALYGLEAELEVEHKHGAVWATVTLRAEHGYLGDTFTGMWYTRTEGRKTSGFTGFVVRGIYRGRRRSTAKITRTQFHREVSSRISQAQYRLREAEEAMA